MFIIIEGLHDSGKSTLVSNICKEIPEFKLYFGKRMFPKLANAEFNSVSDFALGTNCSVTWFAKYFSNDIDVIFDRLHFSEYAYSIVKRKFDKNVAKNKFEMIDSQLALFNVKLIYLKCDYDAMISRVKEKNKVYSQNDFNELTIAFTEVCESTKLNLNIIDTSTNTKNIVLQQAIDFINKKD